MIICVLPDNISFFEMGNARKAKARKVYTPGSKPPGNAFSPGRGRPKKAKDVRKGSMRKGNYRTKYSQATIELAIQDIQEKRLSLNKAAKHYNVPKATLSNRINQLVQDQLGRPTELKKEEEEIIVERLMMMGDWGFPLTCKDLCLLIKSYLDGQGRTTRKMSRLTLPVISCFFLSVKRFCSCTIRYWYLLYVGRYQYWYRYWYRHWWY
jgi:transposase-like protein